MRYPFSSIRGVSSTFQDHLTDPVRRGIPGADYLTVWRTDRVIAPCDGEFREWLDGNGTKYCSFFSTVEMPIPWRVLPIGTRWDFLHCDSVNAPNSATLKSVKEGEVMAVCGNTGFVLPKPTAYEPWLGSHTHVSIRTKWQEKDWLDPQPILDYLAQIKAQPNPQEAPVNTVGNANAEKVAKERDEALERVQRAMSDLDAAKQEFAEKTASLEAKVLELTQQLDQSQPISPVTTDVLVQIVEESVNVDGLLGRWAKWVDNHVKSTTLKSILKYDLFVVVGTWIGFVLTVGVAPLAKQYLDITISVDIATSIGFILGVVLKLFLTRYDTNKDGKLDSQDFTAFGGSV